jgi:hypothetical protein
VDGTGFKRELLRERQLLLCDSISDYLGQDYINIYEVLKQTPLSIMYIVDNDDNTFELESFFSKKHDIKLPDDYYCFLFAKNMKFDYSWFTNSFFIKKDPVVCFLTKDCLTPIWKNMYDTWCIICLQGKMEINLYNNNESESIQPYAKFPNELILVSNSQQPNAKYIKVILSGGQSLFIPHGYWFSLSSIEEFTISLNLRWYNPFSIFLYMLK